MNCHLTVVEPFGGYQRGDHIEDPVTVAEILAGEHARHVLRVAADAPAAAHAAGRPEAGAAGEGA